MKPYMSDEQATYLQVCSMEPDQATKVSQMIKSHTEFSRIGMNINPDRGTYDPFLAKQIPEGEMLVTFCIPCAGINMVDFFREFSNTLNQESTVMAQKERVW